MTVHTRRGFFKSVSATAATAALPATALAYQGPVTETPEPDPIRRWLDQWKVARAKYECAAEDSQEEQDLFQEFHRLESLIAETPARTKDGAQAQLEWILADTNPECFPCPQHREALEAAANALMGGSV